jgi:hypothetical protein
MKALGNANADDFNPKGAGARAASGRGMTFTKACGLGASMVDDLDTVKARYARVKAAERRADRAYEAELRRAEREAAAAAALDELLDTL